MKNEEEGDEEEEEEGGGRGRPERKEDRNEQLEAFTFLQTLVQLQNEDRDWLFKTRSHLKVLSKQKWKELLALVGTQEGGRGLEGKRLFDLVKDMGHGVVGVTEGRKTKKTPELVWVLEFKNPGFDRLGLGGLLRRENVQGKLSESVRAAEQPTIAWSYVHTVRKELLNYKKVVVESANGVPQRCPCSNHSRSDPSLGHVCTGDLSWVKNARLRGLLERGPNFRERRKTNWEEVRQEVSGTIEALVQKWSHRLNKEVEEFEDWKNEVLKEVSSKVDLLARVDTRDKFYGAEVLKDPECQAALRELQRDFVLVSADKSENNVVVVCRRFYAESVAEELRGEDKPEGDGSGEGGSGEGKPQRTYVESTKEIEEILLSHKKFIESYGLEVPDEWLSLPVLYWTPKLHKTPTGKRFILGSGRCSTKTLSKAISKCLKVVQAELKRSCEREFRQTGVRKYWIVESTDEARRQLEEVNRLLSADHLSSWDFSTLFTTLGHGELKEKMTWVVEEAFRKSGKPLLRVYGTRAGWVQKKKKGCLDVSAATLIEWIKWLLDNLYLVHGTKVYEQVVGVPMGTDCAPFLATLYLFAREYQWATRQVEVGNKAEVRSLRFTSRFVDDLATVNDNGLFARVWRDIYPAGLKLNQENKSPWSTHFLDTRLAVNDGRIVTRHYDKRDAFPFKAKRYTDLRGNVPFYSSHAQVCGILCRLSRSNDNFTDFSRVLKKLVSEDLLNQGFNKEILKKYALKEFRNNQWRYSKYAQTEVSFSKRCFGS